jgi:hypothetical protein
MLDVSQTQLALSLADEYARRFEQFKDFQETPSAIRWMLEPRRALEKLLAGEPVSTVEIGSWHPEDPDNPGISIQQLVQSPPAS